MLAQRISSINTVSSICERTGADVDEIAKAIGLDPRLGSKFLKAGLGFGGSCFKKDILSLVYLAQTLNLEEVAEYWMQVITINEFQRNRFVKRVVSNLHGTLIGKKISILGYAFKKDTSDTRESPAVEVVKSLLADNPAEIAIFDPRCNPEDVKDEIKRLFATTGLKLLKPDGPIEGTILQNLTCQPSLTCCKQQSTKIPTKHAPIPAPSSFSLNGINSDTHLSKTRNLSS